MHFSMISLKQNRKNIAQRLAAEKYTSQALVPASPWMENTNIAPPQLILSEDKKTVEVKLADPINTRWLAIWKRTEQQWLFSVQAASKLNINTNAETSNAPARQISVMAISRSGQESIKGSVQLP